MICGLHSVALVVANVPAGMEPFADIEGAVRIGWSPLWWLLLIPVAAIFGCWLLKRLRAAKHAATTAGPPPRPPAEIAREALAELKATGVNLAAEPFTVRLTDILRSYIEAALEVPAREQTSEEFLEEIQRKPSLPAILRERMPEFLSACDRVKFARQDMNAAVRDDLIQTADRVIEASESQLSKPAGPTAKEGDAS